MDGIRATPIQYPILGLLADKLKKAQQFAVAPGGYANPPAEILLNLLGIPAVQQTMERVAYGEPLTTGRGMTTQVRPEVLEAAMTLLPVGATVAKGGAEAAMKAGRAGERLAEKMVPQIMERGGMPASLLEGMSQGTKSRIFIGPESSVWNKDAAFLASKMEKKGATPQEIWQATGTARGPDKMWRQEISDAGATFVSPGDIKAKGEAAAEQLSLLKEQLKPNRTGQKDLFPSLLTEAKKPIKEKVQDIEQMLRSPYGYESSSPLTTGHFAELAYNNPELYKAYPGLAKDIIIRQGISEEGGLRGSLQGRLMNISQNAINKGDAASTATHEMQHAIQELENFAVGGNARDFAKMKYLANQEIGSLNAEMSNLVKEMDNPAISADMRKLLKTQYDDLISRRNSLVSQAQIDPMQAYGHLMGEAEARLAQRRINLTPEQRIQNYPFEYTGEIGYGLDVKPENLIHMTQSGDIVEHGLLGAAPKIVERGPAQSLLDYRGSHTAPGPDFGAPLHDLTGGGQMYPADVYSPKAAQYYGTGYPKADKEAFDLAKRVKGNPDAEVTMYRAVPNNKDITDINAGDWVTLSKDYAKTHGESALQGDYKIISKKVKAKDLWTNADSIHEFGYHPQ